MQRKTLPVLFATLLLDMTGAGMVFPILPILFTDPSSPSFLLNGYSVSAQYAIAGVIASLFGLFQFLGAPLLGELSDIYGRKKLLTVGVATLAFSQLIFGFGVTIASLPLLFISRAVAGMAAANFSIVQASIADVSEPHDRAKNFGVIGAAFGVGFVLGPILGGWIAASTGDAAAPFWLATALGVLNVVFLTIFLPETNKHRKTDSAFTMWKGLQNIRAAFRDRDARPLYLSSFLYMSGFTFFGSFIGILLVARFGLSEAGIGTFFGIVGAWVIVTQLIILRILTKKYSERTILRFTLITLAFSLSAYPFLPSLAFLYALIPLVAIPQGLTMANMGALISKSVSADKQGAALGINGSLMAFAQGLIPLFAGFGSSFGGIASPFIAAGIFALAAWLVLIKTVRRAYL